MIYKNKFKEFQDSFDFLNSFMIIISLVLLPSFAWCMRASTCVRACVHACVHAYLLRVCVSVHNGQSYLLCAPTSRLQ